MKNIRPKNSSQKVAYRTNTAVRVGRGVGTTGARCATYGSSPPGAGGGVRDAPSAPPAAGAPAAGRRAGAGGGGGSSGDRPAKGAARRTDPGARLRAETKRAQQQVRTSCHARR